MRLTGGGFAAAVVLVLAAGWAAGAGAGKPDFSGTWELDTARSDYAWQRPPRSLTQWITHHDPELKVETFHVDEDGTEGKGEAHYTTDGKECEVTVMGNHLTATAVWEGEVLVMTTKGDFGGDAILLVDRWRRDGGTLTVSRHFEGRGRKAEQRLVFGRQE